MKILVTGGCGFIGSNLIDHLIESDSNVCVLNIDALTYAADPSTLSHLVDNERYGFAHVDIRDRLAVHDVVKGYRPDAVMHLAAESHVDNSIAEPAAFVTTNVIGTYNLLEEARALWGSTEGRFLHVSTDEVYGSLSQEGAFREEDAYRPNSPYSASKAGSDHLVRAWGETYGMNVVTTNCSNNFGPHQHREKLIPTVIASAIEKRPIPVYGDGGNVRDWLFVGDHCAALTTVLREGKRGETYMIGTRNEWRNIDLVREICRILDEEVGEGPEGTYASLITFVTDRPGHDRRYAVDPSKIERELGWKADGVFSDDLRRTIRWYCGRWNVRTIVPVDEQESRSGTMNG